MTALTHLLSGELNGSGRLVQSLTHLSSTLELLEGSLPLHSASTLHDRMVRPFLIRSMLEVGCTILIGRIDSFRLLSVAELQSQATYEPGTKFSAAMQWSGDILSSEGRAPKDKWASTKRPEDMTRALLGDYVEELVVRPAFLALLDYLSQAPSGSTVGPWTEALRNMEPTNLVPRLRADATRLYSTTSKGVHHEFVLSVANYYDAPTIEQLASDAVNLLGTLGLVVNFAEPALFRMPPERALEFYEEIQP